MPYLETNLRSAFYFHERTIINFGVGLYDLRRKSRFGCVHSPNVTRPFPAMLASGTRNSQSRREGITSLIKAVGF